MSDGIIDLTSYLKRRRDASSAGGSGTFSLWGAEDERSRFALPLWRAVYLARGTRGGVLSRARGGAGPGALTPFIVLDLQRDPANLEFSPATVEGLDGARVPALEESGGGSVAVALGENDAGAWYLVVDGVPAEERLSAREREDLLFLAGECAGLLFLQSLAPGSRGPEEDP